MSIQDSIQDTFDEFDELSHNFDKEMEEIDELIQNMEFYEKKNEEDKKFIELAPYLIYLCNFIIDNKTNTNSKERKLIEYNAYFYSNGNLYYQYLNLLDFFVKYIILNC